ncbi:MAG: c-type cytochrome [Candidatus Methylomirabilales bacterium]
MATLILLFLVAAAAPEGFAGQKSDPEAGKKIYGLLCASCHGNTGKGDGPAAATLPTKPQNHTDGKYMNTLTDEYLFKFIKGGGASVGKSPLMPPWGGQLKDPDIRNLVSYIRSLAVPPYQPTK